MIFQRILIKFVFHINPYTLFTVKLNWSIDAEKKEKPRLYNY